MTVKSSCWHWGNRISRQGELGAVAARGEFQNVLSWLGLGWTRGLFSDHRLVSGSAKGKLHFRWFTVGFLTVLEFS